MLSTIIALPIPLTTSSAAITGTIGIDIMFVLCWVALMLVTRKEKIQQCGLLNKQQPLIFILKSLPAIGKICINNNNNIVTCVGRQLNV